MRARIGVLVALLVVACSRPAADPPPPTVPASPPPSSLAAGEATAGPGPAVGQPLPAFEALDQQGRTQTLESLRGPNGLYLNVNRSVVW